MNCTDTTCGAPAAVLCSLGSARPERSPWPPFVAVCCRQAGVCGAHYPPQDHQQAAGVPHRVPATGAPGAAGRLAESCGP